MALTAEVLFVNVDYMKRLTNLNGSVESSYVVPSIILAQDKYMQEYLGTDLLNYLKTNIGSLSGVHETLMDSYVRKATCWWTMVELIPDLYVRMDNGGLIIRSGEANPITLDDLNREVERARQNAMFYTQRMVSYLTDNSSSFPQYTSNTYPDMQPNKSVYNQNGFTVSHGKNYYKYQYKDKCCVVNSAECNC